MFADFKPLNDSLSTYILINRYKWIGNKSHFTSMYSMPSVDQVLWFKVRVPGLNRLTNPSLN